MSHLEWGLLGIFVVLLMILDQLRRLNRNSHDDEYNPEPPADPITPAEKERNNKLALWAEIARRFDQEEREKEIQQGLDTLRKAKAAKHGRPTEAEHVPEPSQSDKTEPSADLTPQDVELNKLCNSTVLQFDDLLEGKIQAPAGGKWRVLSHEEADEIRNRQPPPAPNPDEAT